MVRTQIQLTEKQMIILKKIASKRHISLAELIRQGVDMVVKKSTLEISDEDRARRALSVAGKFKSGLKDLSKEHDKYLSEDFAS